MGRLGVEWSEGSQSVPTKLGSPGPRRRACRSRCPVDGRCWGGSWSLPLSTEGRVNAVVTVAVSIAGCRGPSLQERREVEVGWLLPLRKGTSSWGVRTRFIAPHRRDVGDLPRTTNRRAISLWRDRFWVHKAWAWVSPNRGTMTMIYIKGVR